MSKTKHKINTEQLQKQQFQELAQIAEEISETAREYANESIQGGETFLLSVQVGRLRSLLCEIIRTEGKMFNAVDNAVKITKFI